MIICTWRIREWELQIWSWSSSVQPEIATLLTISFQYLKKRFSKVGRSVIGCQVVNHVGIYGSKAAEGLSAFQRRSCFVCDATGATFKCSLIHSKTGITCSRDKMAGEPWMIWAQKGYWIYKIYHTDQSTTSFCCRIHSLTCRDNMGPSCRDLLISINFCIRWH